MFSSWNFVDRAVAYANETVGSWLNTDKPLALDADEIDLAKVTYHPKNNSHREYINHCIKSFNVHLDELVYKDKILSCGIVLDSLFLLNQYFTPITCGVFALGILGGYFYLNRYDKSMQVHDDLARLYRLYLWCAKNQGTDITHDDMFLALMDAIAPFVATDHLVLWKANSGSFSKKYVEILSSAPHTTSKKLFTITESQEINDETLAKPIKVNWSLLFKNEKIRKMIPVVYGHDVDNWKPANRQ